MVSTPSRSRAATRISLPCIVGPTSARCGETAAFVSVVVLFMFPSRLRLVIAGKQKTHDRCQPWVLVEMALNRTSPGGIAACDGYPDRNLQHSQYHGYKSKRAANGRSSVDSAGFSGR